MPRPNRETAIAIALSLFLLLLSLTALRRDASPAAGGAPSGGAADARRPLVPGANGRLVFVLQSDEADQPAGRLWTVSLADGSLGRGPFVPPPLEGFGEYQVSAGPVGTVAESHVAFIAGSGETGNSFLYVADLEAKPPAAVGAMVEAAQFDWGSDGALHVLVPAAIDAGLAFRLERVSLPFGRVDTQAELPYQRAVSLAVLGSEPLLLHPNGIDDVGPHGTGTLLRGWRPLSAGTVAPVLVARGPGIDRRDFDPELDELRLWSPNADPPYRWHVSHFGLDRVLGWAPDGSAFVATGTLRGRPGVWLIPIWLEIDVAPLVVVDSVEELDRFRHAVVSADGRFVYVSDRLSVFAYEVARQELTRIDLPGPLRGRAISGSFAWIPDELGR